MRNLEKYTAHINLEEIGIQGQKRISGSKVLVIGAGGLGTPVIQYLSTAGVGRIGIVDFDTVRENNLPRQFLYKPQHIGENKAEVLSKILQYTDSELIPYPVMLENGNAFNLLKDYDLVVDCTDHIPTRYLISDVSLILHKADVFGGIHKYQAQISVFNYQNGPTYRCLFPEVGMNHFDKPCSETGVFSTVAGLAGLYQANEVLKIILGIRPVLNGKLLIFDVRSLHHQLVEFKRKDDALMYAHEGLEQRI